MLIPEVKKCEYCKKIRANQLKFTSDIKNEFKKLRIWESNRLIDEPIGLEGIKKLATEVYGNVTANEILNPLVNGKKNE